MSTAQFGVNNRHFLYCNVVWNTVLTLEPTRSIWSICATECITHFGDYWQWFIRFLSQWCANWLTLRLRLHSIFACLRLVFFVTSNLCLSLAIEIWIFFSVFLAHVLRRLWLSLFLLRITLCQFFHRRIFSSPFRFIAWPYFYPRYCHGFLSNALRNHHLFLCVYQLLFSSQLHVILPYRLRFLRAYIFISIWICCISLCMWYLQCY